MRWIEFGLVLFHVWLMGWLTLGRPKSQRGWLIGGGIGAVLLVVHAFVEGMRWPMIPVYLITLWAIAGGARLFFHSAERPSNKRLRRWNIVLLGGVAAVYAAVAIALPLLFPVFSFAEPTGPHAIGTVTYHWIDSAREEKFTEVSGDSRELMVQIWYPASSEATGKPEPYLSDPVPYVEGLHELLQLPEFLFSGLKLVNTHAITNAELADTESKYPVLLFSHGFMGYKNQNMFQIEQLASHGYIVVGIEHAYSSVASVFPDQHVVKFDSEGKTGYEQMKYSFMDERNRVWVEDAKFVLDQIEALSANDPGGLFTGRLDLEHVGMFGHSFGGATTVQMLLDDSRIQAGINMDGVLYGEKRIPADGLKKPFLLMSADDTLKGVDHTGDAEIAALGTNREEIAAYYDELFARYEPVTAGGNYWMTFKNSKHMSFSDLYLLTPLFKWMEGGDVRRTHELINEYTLDFFDHYLKGQPLQYLNRSLGDHPEYTLQQGAE
ncbi:alpha/beta hydrolase family protein [Paenibacillus aquistagni]|uniref:Predicted dienelactone hydrolase n=1 Tax=Paenibacillus aquistagni TaxID=1852522 RepID=A0A1X7LUE5_9BACL|nr:acetylhydrolase [Paenibacillus aquistagni]SMG57491.1 Predicted dienelactone hydrolase [Paenibacillus aquistagni]